MEYFESNIDVIKREVKANRTHRQISDLFKYSFPEVRRGFSQNTRELSRFDFFAYCGISKQLQKINLTLFSLGGRGLLMPAPTLISSQFQTISDNPSIS